MTVRIEVEVTATQTVVVEATDEDVAQYGVRAMAEELGAMKFDPDAANWDYYGRVIEEPNV